MLADGISIVGNMAADRYTELDPRLTDYDAGVHLHIADRAQADAVRRKAIEYFWPSGRLPAEKLPAAVALSLGAAPGSPRTPEETLCHVGREQVSRIEWLDTEVDFDYHHFAALLHPVKEARPPRLFIVHHGHGVAVPGEGLYEVSSLALEQGLTVLMMHMPLVGWNVDRTFKTPEGDVIVEGWQVPGHNRLVPALEGKGGSSLRFFIEPVVVFINYFLKRNPDCLDVSMIGLSGGGWTTQVAAALDERIGLSIGVAGSYPLYLRRVYPGAEGDAEQEWAPLYKECASWLDLYVLAGYGHGRHGIQILNQYDPYFYGLGHVTYSGLVSKSVERMGQGRWECVMDKSHRQHIISPWAIREVVAPALGLSAALARRGRVDQDAGAGAGL